MEKETNKKMNILLISSSPRKEKSQTFALAKKVLAGCNPEQSEIIHLCDCEIKFCKHCELCHKKIMNCPIKDDVFMILKKMLDADGIILATPNYINQVTASMKALFDRSSHFIHCKRLLGKYVAGVVSSGSGMDKPVIDYLKHYSFTCGAQFAGSVYSKVPLSEEKMEEAFILGQKLATAIKNKKIFSNQMKIIEQGKDHFRNIIIARKHDWQEEYEYWKNKNWL
jgi:multimeric flavodoxin WrbA